MSKRISIFGGVVTATLPVLCIVGLWWCQTDRAIGRIAEDASAVATADHETMPSEPNQDTTIDWQVAPLSGSDACLAITNAGVGNPDEPDDTAIDLTDPNVWWKWTDRTHKLEVLDPNCLTAESIERIGRYWARQTFTTNANFAVDVNSVEGELTADAAEPNDANATCASVLSLDVYEYVGVSTCLTIVTDKGDIDMHFRNDRLEVEGPEEAMNRAAQLFFEKYLKDMADAYLREQRGTP